MSVLSFPSRLVVCVSVEQAKAQKSNNDSGQRDEVRAACRAFRVLLEERDAGGQGPRGEDQRGKGKRGKAAEARKGQAMMSEETWTSFFFFCLLVVLRCRLPFFFLAEALSSSGAAF